MSGKKEIKLTSNGYLEVENELNKLREEDRPIAFLVQMASQFESKILFETGNKQVNVKSMMGMMSLGLDLDRLEDLTVVADGADEEEAVSKIEGYLTKGA